MTKERTIQDFCVKCGSCCRRFVFRTIMGEKDYEFYRHVYNNGFRAQQVEVYFPSRNMMDIVIKIPCRFLDPVTNKCMSYESRPDLCRSYYCKRVREEYQRYKDGMRDE